MHGADWLQASHSLFNFVMFLSRGHRAEVVTCVECGGDWLACFAWVWLVCLTEAIATAPAVNKKRGVHARSPCAYAAWDLPTKGLSKLRDGRSSCARASGSRVRDVTKILQGMFDPNLFGFSNMPQHNYS